MRDIHQRAGTGFKRPSLVIIPLIISYIALIIPFSDYMRHKPFVEKLGLLPRVEVLQMFSADQKQLVGASMIMKVLMYFGGLVEKDQAKLVIPPDYQAMSRILHGAVKLDPYNMDAYYFAQAILVWDVGQYKIANDLLQYGMKYRTWDWYLPFFAGFNYAYFLRDYEHAAHFYMETARLSGEPLFANLAGRYMHEAGQTELAITYLSAMEKSAKNGAIKKTYFMRLQALQAVRSIESARDAYRQDSGRLPGSIEELMRAGYLKRLPADPYGGRFYIEPDGKVTTTSKFAFMKKAQ